MREKLLVIPLLFLLIACGGKKNNPVPNPTMAALTLPTQNAVCTTGTIISNTQSSITFMWNAADNANSYDLYIKNLLTAATSTQTTTDTKLTVILSRNTPYSWYIISKSNRTTVTAQSATWKFYNSGPGVVTYAPYPAEITSPTYGQSIASTTGAINLTWTGSAIDNNTITNYDVYFGTTKTPAIFKNAISDSFVNGVSVISGTTYYWRVITRDVNGNTSDSGLYQFAVK
ncbi:hypothetical protein [Mucilaginibacter xinganensis]|uniref:Fibronectin type-III domain-containing protein n=1 Tax=Mucilaginibacter xinganensis TaxID=1234841 RepID=A0A223NXP2_9SPHI|nr:hypothetical protein [Mucilaginibacter xinganensis]ASU34331.1 hypothetical protein MuYL_2444 [Mucilaginibacter xinganensis]